MCAGRSRLGPCRSESCSYRETEHLRVLIANERKDRLALVAPIVAALGHEVIAREIEVEDVGAVTARERPDVALVGLGESSEHALDLIEQDRPGGRLPGDRPAPRARPRLRQGGVQARRLRLHHRRRRRRLAELDRHRAAPLRRVPRPRRRVRPPRPDRAGQGHPDGAPRRRRGRPPSRCCATTRAPPTASSSTSPPPSSTATACCPSSRRPSVTLTPEPPSGPIDAVRERPTLVVRVSGRPLLLPYISGTLGR